jgi:hypothetical protein
MSIQRTGPFSDNRQTVYIWDSQDGCPLGDLVANLTWLAFSSGPYLKRPGRLVPLPLDDLHHTADRFGYTDRTITFQDEFRLPKSVDLFKSRDLFLRSAFQFYKEFIPDERYVEPTKRIAASLKERALTFHYAVTESTNVSGWTLPLRFECFQEPRPYLENAGSYQRAHGTVKSIDLTTKPEGLFNPALQQTICDFRFNDASNRVHGTTYSWPNAFAPSTNDPLAQQAFERTLEQARRHRLAKP